MSVNEILAYLELHYWVLILVFLGSVLIILRLFYKNLNNENLHSLKVKENERSLLISGMLIALTDKSFCNSYRFKTPQSLSNFLVNTIEEKIN